LLLFVLLRLGRLWPDWTADDFPGWLADRFERMLAS
jgi:hypothetical protein